MTDMAPRPEWEGGGTEKETPFRRRHAELLLAVTALLVLAALAAAVAGSRIADEARREAASRLSSAAGMTIRQQPATKGYVADHILVAWASQLRPLQGFGGGSSGAKAMRNR